MSYKFDFNTGNIVPTKKSHYHYNEIIAGKAVCVPQYTEYLITDEIDIAGTLIVEGDLEILSLATQAELDAAEADIAQNASDIALLTVNPSTDHGVPRFNGTTGELQDSGVTIDDSDNAYIPSRVGVATAVDDYSKLAIGGTMTADLAMPAGKAFLDLTGTLNITGSFKRAAAFNANITTTDNGSALQFISGMLFEINKNGTGSWGANAGVWGQAPTIVAARWATSAGSSSLGNHGNTFFSGTPDFAGSGGDFSAGNFSHFEAGRTENNDTRFQYSYGFYAWPQGSTDESAGLFVRAGMNSATFSAAIILADDNDGGRIVFGAGRDASIYYDGTDLVIDPKIVGSGDVKLDGNLNTTEGVKRAVETITASSDTLDSSNHIVFADASSNAVAINLPAAASHSGREYYIKAIDTTNNVTVNPNGSETIDGDSSTRTISLNATLKIISNGTGWYII